MNINTQAVLDGLVTGIATASVWAFALWVWNVARNLRLRFRLLKVFSKQSGSLGTDSFGFGIHNHTSVPVTVRDVRIYHGTRPRYAYRLNYVGPSHEVMDEHQPRRRRPRPFDPATPDEEMISWDRQRPPQTDERGFATLPPQTGGDWRMPVSGIRDQMTIDAVRVVIEYTTLFRDRAIIAVHAKASTLKLLNDMLDRAKKDKARVQRNKN